MWEAEIQKWFDKNQNSMFDDLEKLIEIPSVAELASEVYPYGQACREVMKCYADIAESLGFATESLDGRVMRVVSPSCVDRPSIGLWHHLDVVPAGEGWLHEPYKMTQCQGYLIGRGVKDNKGPAVASLYALNYLKNSCGLNIDDICIFAGCEEEKGMSDVKWLIENNVDLPKYNIVVDSRYPVCIGEKGILNIELVDQLDMPEEVIEIRGGESQNSVPGAGQAVIAFEEGQVIEALKSALPEWAYIKEEKGKILLEVKGRSAHAAHPESGINAINRLFTLLAGQIEDGEPWNSIIKEILGSASIERFKKLAKLTRGFKGQGLNIECSDQKSGELTAVPSILTMEGRKTVLKFNIRYPIDLKQGESLVKKIKKAGRGLGFDLEKFDDRPSSYFDGDHPLVRSLISSYRKYSGEEDAEAFTISGGTYARLLPNGIGYGFRLVPEPKFDQSIIPEGHGNAHGPDEAVAIGQFEKQLKILTMSLGDIIKSNINKWED